MLKYSCESVRPLHVHWGSKKSAIDSLYHVVLYRLILVITKVLFYKGTTEVKSVGKKDSAVDRGRHERNNIPSAPASSAKNRKLTNSIRIHQSSPIHWNHHCLPLHHQRRPIARQLRHSSVPLLTHDQNLRWKSSGLPWIHRKSPHF